MIWRFLAELVLVAHLAFIVFAVFGALLVVRWPRLAWAHVPAALWAGLISLMGWVCPLTPLENHFRRLGGQAGYEGGFIETYITALIYPDGLTRGVQLMLGAVVVALNVVLYYHVMRRRSGPRPAAANVRG
jgi:hypothetical protein